MKNMLFAAGLVLSACLLTGNLLAEERSFTFARPAGKDAGLYPEKIVLTGKSTAKEISTWYSFTLTRSINKEIFTSEHRDAVAYFLSPERKLDEMTLRSVLHMAEMVFPADQEAEWQKLRPSIMTHLEKGLPWVQANAAIIAAQQKWDDAIIYILPLLRLDVTRERIPERRALFRRMARRALADLGHDLPAEPLMDALDQEFPANPKALIPITKIKEGVYEVKLDDFMGAFSSFMYDAKLSRDKADGSEPMEEMREAFCPRIGLEYGDLINRINGRAFAEVVENQDSTYEDISQSRTLQFEMERNKKTITLEMRLKQ